MLTIVPAKCARVNFFPPNGGPAELILQNELSVEQRMGIDRLQLLPLQSDRDDKSNIAKPKVEDEDTVRKKALDNVQQALFELDQLISAAKMLKQKEFITLEMCRRNLKRTYEEDPTLTFIESIRENTEL